MAKVAGILGKKVGMTQLFDDKGDVHPATVLQAGPCVITQHKTETRDGYPAAQIGLVEFVKESRLTQPMKGHLGKHNLPPVKFVREVPIEVDEKAQDDGAVKAGDRVLVDIFEGERFVDIVGVSKGRGFQGVVKRHHFGGGPKSHGSMFQITGSIGSHVGAHGQCARDGTQSASAGRGKRRQPAGGGRQRAWAEWRIFGHHQSEEAAKRAARICRADDS